MSQGTHRPEDPAFISARTLAHYNDHAVAFWEGTRDHDVRQNIEALLRHIRGASPLRILDFGCGPGRDLAAFRALGHEPIGLEGSPPLAAMAREHGGCEVWEQDFLALNLPAGRFDGIFANASLFHVPCQELPRAGELRRGLESRTLRGVSRSRIMARVSRTGGVRGIGALLSTTRIAARATALACKRVAQER